MTEPSGRSAGSQQFGKRLALIVGIPLLCLSASIPWFGSSEGPVSRVVNTGVDSSGGPLPVLPAAIKSPATPGRPQQVLPAGAAQPSVPTRQAETAPGAKIPRPAPGAKTSGPAPDIMLPNTAPAPPHIYSAPAPDSDAKITTTGPRAPSRPPTPKPSTPQPSRIRATPLPKARSTSVHCRIRI